MVKNAKVALKWVKQLQYLRITNRLYDEFSEPEYFLGGMKSENTLQITLRILKFYIDADPLFSSEVFFFGLQNFLHAPIVLCYCALVFFYFSGFGMFQVKYDGQLRTKQDVHSLACDVHCLRVQKSNSGANKFMNWTDGGCHGSR